MKNKTSACNLQVINHKTTIKKIIRVYNSEAMDPWRPLHRWCAAWSEAVGSLLLVAQTCWFSVCFLEGMGGKVFMSSVLSISSDVCQDELSAHCQSSHPCGNTYPKAVIPEGADTLLTPDLQTEWGRDPCPRAGCGPQAPSQPCSHSWGCPVTIRDNRIMGLQLHAPSSVVFTSWAFDQDYRLPHMC